MKLLPSSFSFPRGVLPQWAMDAGLSLPAPMHPVDIRAALIKAGTSQAGIAEQLSVSHNAVSLVVHGRTKSSRIARAIAKATGISIHVLWPGRYVTRSHLKRAA